MQLLIPTYSLPLRSRIFFIGVVSAVCISGAIVATGVYFSSRFLPNTTVASVAVGGKTLDEAQTAILATLEKPSEYSLSLVLDEETWKTDSNKLGLQFPLEATLSELFSNTHQESLLTIPFSAARAYLSPTTVSIDWQFDQNAVAAFVSQVEETVNYPESTPSATLTYSNSPQSIKIFPGTQGRAVEKAAVIQMITTTPVSMTDSTFEVKTASTGAVLTEDAIVQYTDQVTTLVGKTARLETEYGSLLIPDTKLVALAQFPRGVQKDIADSILTEWEERFATEPQDAVFEYDPDTLQVSTFIPDRPGLGVDRTAAYQSLAAALNTIYLQESNDQYIQISLPLHTTPPHKTLANTNTLGVVERVGFGESEYDHSIPSRIHNVALTAEKINNTLVAPGEEFSFNKALGEVSQRTGFKPAYVIKSGKTELGDGGGVCQVSTTLFRALLDAGLEITRRLPHSYRVSYYELNAKPGLDATVYAGNVDLRFKNDTEKYILIHTTTDSENLYMNVELYGTSDGRTAEVIDHKVWGATPPLPTEYIVDPSLQPGQKKQIDWAVGGVKASFVHVVKDASGEITRTDTYTSNYRPWSAKYLVGPDL